jgi:hypothetical protein
MSPSQDQINLNINDGEPFFSHEVTVNFTPTQLTLDFKCITPRNDPRSKKPSFQLKHNVIMLEPWHGKALVAVLKNVIKKYEDEFGKIKKPKAIEKAEQKRKTLSSKPEKIEMPSYFG